MKLWDRDIGRKPESVEGVGIPKSPIRIEEVDGVLSMRKFERYRWMCTTYSSQI